MIHPRAKGVVTCFFEDADGILWVGTDNGLARWADGKWVVITTKNGLLSDTVFQLLEDDSENMWMSSNKGIFRVARRQLNELANRRIETITPVIYGKADGMKDPECAGGTQPAGSKSRDGKMWFPTTKGVVMVDPARSSPNTLPPPVHIEEILFDDNPVPAGEGLEVGPTTGNIEFHYTALSLTSPEKVKFKYQLEGFESAWVNAGTRRVAYYTRVPPGRYRFRVVGSNNDGVWNEAGASMSFELIPHFYQTKLFYALCLLSTAATTSGLYMLRVRNLKRREKELARRVEETMAKVKVLSGLLPICASCKKIRDDKGYWSQIEQYIRDHSQADFSHGICPECMRELYPDYSARMKQSDQAP